MERTPPGERAGLSPAHVRRLTQEYGPNDIVTGREAPGIADVLLRQLGNPLLSLLVIAAGVAWYLGEAVDAWIILGAVGVAIGLGFAQEYKAERTLAALNRLVAPMAWVVRDGERKRVLARSVVPGDLLILSAGDKVSADASIVQAGGFEVSEAALTGESAPVSKQSGTTVYAGTVVLRGNALAEATSIGRATKMGQIATLVARTDEEETPLELRIRRFSRQLAAVIALLILCLVALSLWQGRSFDTTFLLAISLAVAVIPEGLPIMVTLVLAIGMERLAREHATVRRMAAVEALGSVTVAAIDKTGTMTTGQLAVAEVIGEDPELVLGTALLASQVGSALIGTPDPLETALVAEAATQALDLGALEQRFVRARTIPFDARHRWMASVVRHGQTTSTMIKGAPEGLLRHCALSARKRQTVAALIEKRTKQGERVLLIARARGAFVDRQLPDSLTYLGLITFNDPLRPAAREAIAALGARGIRLLMITGDHPGTARVIARQLGLTLGRGAVVTGDEIRSLDQELLDRRLKSAVVCARILPEQKLAIVAALQRTGEVVAMTGDGVNDGPALKKADIGIALGKSGTEVAKETADLVLLDDELGTLVTAVDGGRRILATLEKGMIFLLGTNLAEFLAVAVATGLGWPLPLAATQILWVNLVADSVPVVGLALEHHQPALRYRPPQQTSLLHAFSWRRILVLGLVMAAVTLGFYWLANPSLADETSAHVVGQTMAFTALAIGQLALVLTVRSRRDFRWPWQYVNPILLATIALGIALQVAVVRSAGQWLHAVPLEGGQWALIAIVTLAVLLFVELHKELERWFRRPTPRRQSPAQLALSDLSQTLRRPIAYYRRWRYKNTALLVASLVLFVYFLDSTIIQESLQAVGSLGYFGAFVTGIFFTSTFTVAPAGVVLYTLADSYNPYLIAILAGAGAVLGDYLILRFLKNRVFDELAPLATRLGGSFFRALFRSPYFTWLLPLIGAAIMLSPLPDETGIALLGLSKVRLWQFLAIAFVLNAVGIFLIVTAARLF